MKNLLIATVVAGAAVAGLMLYLRNQTAQQRTVNHIEDAADDAYKTMNKHIGRAERTFDHALN